jgi:hypothetical protein
MQNNTLLTKSKKMKQTCSIFIVLMLFSLNLQGQTLLDTLVNKAKNNQISEKWNVKLFDSFKKNADNTHAIPMHTSAFPSEKYEYYVFSKPFEFKIDTHSFSCISFGENIGPKTGKQFDFKYEITLIFYTGSKTYTIEQDISSRNYPYLTMQGTVNLNNVYDFVCVKSPDDSGFMLVNLKAFDLRFGQTIIIFPNSDNSFHYLQFKENPKNNEDFDNFLNTVKSNPKMLEMIKLIK